VAKRSLLLEGAKAGKAPREKCSCVDRGVNPNTSKKYAPCAFDENEESASRMKMQMPGSINDDVVFVAAARRENY
jgi:hypothetical protein